MADGMLIVEAYEYRDDSLDVPPFEYIPCDLDKCLKKNRKTTLREIIRSDFENLSRKNRDTLKLQ